MTVKEVEWFANHKYGECVYVVETKEEVRILTSKSQWCIFYETCLVLVVILYII